MPPGGFHQGLPPCKAFPQTTLRRSPPHARCRSWLVPEGLRYRPTAAIRSTASRGRRFAVIAWEHATKVLGRLGGGMLAISFNSVLIIAAIAVLVPVVLGVLPRLPVPEAVLEVIA